MESEKLTNLVENIYYGVPLYEDNESEEYETLEEIFGLRTAVRGAKRVGNVLRGRGHLNVTIDDAKQYVEQFLRDLRTTRRSRITQDQFIGWVYTNIIETQAQGQVARKAAIQNLVDSANQVGHAMGNQRGHVLMSEKQALSILRQFLHTGGASQTAFADRSADIGTLPTVSRDSNINRPTSPISFT